MLSESSNLQNMANSLPRRKIDAGFSQPGGNRRFRINSFQQKGEFESDVLDKPSQGISESKRNNTEKDQKWERPRVPDFKPHQRPLQFQSIEAEEGSLHGDVTTVKLYGVTSEGNSVMLHVKDFKHYLYVAAPPTYRPEDHAAYKAYLETRMAWSNSAQRRWLKQ